MDVWSILFFKRYLEKKADSIFFIYFDLFHVSVDVISAVILLHSHI